MARSFFLFICEIIFTWRCSHSITTINSSLNNSIRVFLFFECLPKIFFLLFTFESFIWREKIYAPSEDKGMPSGGHFKYFVGLHSTQIDAQWTSVGRIKYDQVNSFCFEVGWKSSGDIKGWWYEVLWSTRKPTRVDFGCLVDIHL